VATENTATGAPFLVDFSCASLPTKPTGQTGEV